MIDWLDGFQIGVTIVRIMCNPALRVRHWVEMSEIASKYIFFYPTFYSFIADNFYGKIRKILQEFDIMPDAGTTLRKITKFGIEHLLPSFEIISIGANKELKLQMDLAEMIRQWVSMTFPIDAYKKNTDIQILGSIEDIQVRNIIYHSRTRPVHDNIYIFFHWHRSC